MFLKGLTLLAVKTFWETSVILPEHWYGHIARSVYYDGGSKASFYCIVRDRWKFSRDHLGLSKRLKKHWAGVLKRLQKALSKPAGIRIWSQASSPSVRRCDARRAALDAEHEKRSFGGAEQSAQDQHRTQNHGRLGSAVLQHERWHCE